jgi:hypothetical protein
MDCEYWISLPAPATPVSAIQIHPDFHQNLCYPLDRLRDQILACNELLSIEVLEYRFRHTPPGFYDQDETQRLIKEYMKNLEPATPQTPTPSASISSPITHSISHSSPHLTYQTIPSPPAPLNPVPAEIDRHESTSPLSIDKKRKRYAEGHDESQDQSKRQRRMQVGVQLEMRNGTEDVAVPACLSQRSVALGLSRDLGPCELQVGSPS